MKKLCVITATRAEYGFLKNTIRKIQESSYFELCLIATGTHLVQEYGYTVTEIEEDGFFVDEKVDMLLNSDSQSAIGKSIGLAAIEFAAIFEHHKPDMIIVAGDRYELLPICSTALVAQIPIAHISGGEKTEGAIDDVVRHCVSKMSFLHFTACEEYRNRVIQLGESPDRVFNVGDVGVENIKLTNFMEKEELEKSIGFVLDKPYASVTFHPVTLDNSSEKYFEEVLKSLEYFPDMKFIITKANADSGGRKINELIERFVDDHLNCIAFSSMGSLRYLSSLKYADMIIGNSSSGIVEAPTLKIPTVNIGDRQKGRLLADSIINCKPDCEDIINAINKALSNEFKLQSKNTVNPYGMGDTSRQIVDIIKDFFENDKINLKKEFYDII